MSAYKSVLHVSQSGGGSKSQGSAQGGGGASGQAGKGVHGGREVCEGQGHTGGPHRVSEVGIQGAEGTGATAEVAGTSRGHRSNSRQWRGEGGASSGDRQEAISLCEVLRASQQPGGLRSPGDGVHMLPGSTQVVLMEHRREGSGVLDSGWEWNRGGQSSSAKMGRKEATVERGEHVAKGSQQVQEGAQHDGRG